MGIFFSFQIGWITRMTDSSAQTSKTLMYSYHMRPHHMSFKISFKMLFILAEIPILYA